MTLIERQRHATNVHGFPARNGMAIATRWRHRAASERPPTDASGIELGASSQLHKPPRSSVLSQSNASRKDKKATPCRFLATGCKRGAACRFDHSLPVPVNEDTSAPISVAQPSMGAPMVEDDTDVSLLAEAMSGLTTSVPTHVSFGRGRGRAYARIGRR